jgi:hypothetical protein
MAKHGISVRRAAELLGVSAISVRAWIADGAITPQRARGGHSGPYAITDAEVEVLKALAVKTAAKADSGALARIGKLEAERANLLARLAWEHATGEASQHALEDERRRSEALATEVANQRTRVEQLKALSAWDHLRGRHKNI